MQPRYNNQAPMAASQAVRDEQLLHVIQQREDLRLRGLKRVLEARRLREERLKYTKNRKIYVTFRFIMIITCICIIVVHSQLTILWK